MGDGTAAIDRFEGEFEFLSNFSPHSVWLDGTLFDSAEHAFQALKTLDPAERAHVGRQTTPGRAKRAGGRVTLRPDWEAVRVVQMERVLRAKFAQHPDILEQLRATGDRRLVEGNNWGDTFWGVCDGVGENWLGVLLVRVRECL